jgi:hypothetical protein
MRAQHFIVLNAATLATIVMSGCSKPQVIAPPKMTDLGVVEFAPKTPKQFRLGPSQSCTITIHPNGTNLTVDLAVWTTNAVGNVQRATWQDETAPGQQCVFSGGDVWVGLTPTLKMPHGT